MDEIRAHAGGWAALVLITIRSAGLGQLGSGRRGCHDHHKHQSRRRESLSGFAVSRIARLAGFGGQAADAVGGALVTVDLALPAARAAPSSRCRAGRAPRPAGVGDTAR
jgi:hypothetical protein